MTSANGFGLNLHIGEPCNHQIVPFAEGLWHCVNANCTATVISAERVDG